MFWNLTMITIEVFCFVLIYCSGWAAFYPSVLEILLLFFLSWFAPFCFLWSPSLKLLLVNHQIGSLMFSLFLFYFPPFTTLSFSFFNIYITMYLIFKSSFCCVCLFVMSRFLFYRYTFFGLFDDINQFSFFKVPFSLHCLCSQRCLSLPCVFSLPCWRCSSNVHQILGLPFVFKNEALNILTLY